MIPPVNNKLYHSIAALFCAGAEEILKLRSHVRIFQMTTGAEGNTNVRINHDSLVTFSHHKGHWACAVELTVAEDISEINRPISPNFSSKSRVLPAKHNSINHIFRIFFGYSCGDVAYLAVNLTAFGIFAIQKPGNPRKNLA